MAAAAKATASTASPPTSWRHGSGGGNGDGVDCFTVYFVEAQKLQLLRRNESFELTLEPFTYELLLERRISFVPIGLANMLNVGGAVQGFQTVKKDDGGGGDVVAEVAVKGAKEAYSSARLWAGARGEAAEERHGWSRAEDGELDVPATESGLGKDAADDLDGGGSLGGGGLVVEVEGGLGALDGGHEEGVEGTFPSIRNFSPLF
uniref:Stachyose synthase n=3 Tax=Oryza TaxID=4527 RepID=A0A5S6RAJ4_ORYSJ|nr:putative stachyose synthase [Oryza sativa Japonica Group]AAP54210.1 hypothetical protein LOC_Os10g33070 [Oryza sativa Japonica Group]